ncbi:Type II secretion system protein G precursor [Gimesia panareensis]|uniref:Type II secretion system protein G n=1 Tax=Gimesia panareensis TaxID=2527978 RepID=A0A517Q9T3_9PLAN|nr:DUF1559 domain-containing protein [Gimesia panareensis]QDT28351.1 Type II secretion system protein G precursor [Gimesia panareensis]
MKSALKRGFTLIELLVVLAVIGLLIALLVPAVQSARESARKLSCSNHLKQIGIALQNYESMHSVYPFGVGVVLGAPDTNPITSVDSRRYSAHSQLLPFLDLSTVYNKINFNVQPFYPDTTGEPRKVTGIGPNEEIAQTTIPVFLCPSDIDRLTHPWGNTNYRSCNGSNWDGRRGNGMFGQSSAVRVGHITDGLSNTAAYSERILGDDDDSATDMESDLFGLAAPWTEDSFRSWCVNLTESEASTLSNTDSNGGMTWLEGNMNFTRYNHFLPPGTTACKADLTWNGNSMPANSRHGSVVNVVMADGSVRSVSYNIDASVWNAMGSTSGNEVLGKN